MSNHLSMYFQISGPGAAKLEDWYGPICSRTDHTSADKDIESPDTSVSSLSDRTDRQLTDFFRKSGQNPDSWRNRDRQNPDKQTSDKKYGHNPDSRQAPGRIFRLIRRQTRQGQDTDSAVRQRLERTGSNQWIPFYKLFQIRSPLIQFSSWWSFKIFVFGNNISLWRNINLNLKI